jgi:hypothetical protein
MSGLITVRARISCDEESGPPGVARSLLQRAPMKVFSSAVLFTCLALGSATYGQTPEQSTPQKSSDATKVTVTGCLTKGDGANEYSITDQKTGQKVPFSGPSQIDKYVNQTVRLTGTVQDKVFKPEAINQVAATCDKGQ